MEVEVKKNLDTHNKLIIVFKVPLSFFFGFFVDRKLSLTNGSRCKY